MSEVIVPDAGGYVFTGVFQGAAGLDASLVKVEEDGTVEWRRRFYDSENAFSYSVAETDDGGYVLVGSKRSGEEANDGWVLRVDAEGREQWRRSFGGDGADRFATVVTTTDGGYLAVGKTGSFSIEGEDVWTVKLDGDGNEQWQRTHGGAANYSAEDVVRTDDGGYLVGGLTEPSGGGNRDAWLLKLDDVGRQQWERSHGGTASDGMNSVVATADGGYAFAGFTRSYGNGDSDAWLVKVDDQGRQQWRETYGGSRHETAYSGIVSTGGGFLLAGTSNSDGNRDAWVASVDDEGGLRWEGTYGSPESDGLLSIVEAPDGGYVFSGWTDRSSEDELDAWLAKLSEGAGTDEGAGTTTYGTAGTTATPSTTGDRDPSTATTTAADGSTTDGAGGGTEAPATTTDDDDGSGVGLLVSLIGIGSLLFPVLALGGIVLLLAVFVLRRGTSDDDGPSGAGDDGGATGGPSVPGGSAGRGTPDGSGATGAQGGTAGGSPPGAGSDSLERARGALDEAADARRAGDHGAAVAALVTAVDRYGTAVEEGLATPEDREAVESAVLEYVDGVADPGRTFAPGVVSELADRDPGTAGAAEATLLRALGRVDPAVLAGERSVVPRVAGYVTGPVAVAVPASGLLATLGREDPEGYRGTEVVTAIEAGLTHDSEDVRANAVSAAVAVVEAAPADGRPFVPGLVANLGADGAVGGMAVAALSRVLSEYPDYGTEVLPEMATGLRNGATVPEDDAGAGVDGRTVAGVTAGLVADVTDGDAGRGTPLIGPLVALATEGEEPDRAAAFRALANLSAEFPAEARDAVPAARSTLDAGGVRERRNAARLLANVADAHPEAVADAVPELVVAIDDDGDLRTRTAAMEAFGAVGAAVPDAVESEVRLVVGRLDDDSTIAREHAAEAVVRLAETVPEVVEPAAEASDRLRRLQRDPAVGVDGEVLETAAVAVRTDEPMADVDADTRDESTPPTAAETDDDTGSGTTRVFDPGEGGDVPGVCPECGITPPGDDPSTCPNCGTELD